MAVLQHGTDLRAHSIRLSTTTDTLNKDVLGADGLWFPVAPSEFTYSSGDPAWSSNQVLKLGEVPHPVGPGISNLAFSGVLPFVYDSRVCRAIDSETYWRTAIRIVQDLQKLKDDLDTVRVTVTPAWNHLFHIDTDLVNEEMRITNFTWTERAARIWHREYSITFAGVKKATIEKRGPTRVFALPSFYITKAGEDLRDVAIRFYGNVRMWKAIASINKKKTASVPTGTRLKLPKDKQARKK